MLGFIRIMTHRGILGNPMRVQDAIRRVRRWLDHPRVQVLTPGELHRMFTLSAECFIDRKALSSNGVFVARATFCA